MRNSLTVGMYGDRKCKTQRQKHKHQKQKTQRQICETQQQKHNNKFTINNDKNRKHNEINFYRKCEVSAIAEAVTGWTLCH